MSRSLINKKKKKNKVNNYFNVIARLAKAEEEALSNVID